MPTHAEARELVMPRRLLPPALLAALLLALPVAAKPLEKPGKPGRETTAPARPAATKQPAAPGPARAEPATPGGAAHTEAVAPGGADQTEAAAPASATRTEAAAPGGAAPPEPAAPPRAAPTEAAAPSLAGAVAPVVPPPALPPPPPLPARLPAMPPPAVEHPAQPAIAAVPDQLAGLAAWVGCAPRCGAAATRLGQRLRSNFVLQFPPLRTELERMLGRRPWQELQRLAESGPAIERRDDWVRVALCRQDACATVFVVLFVQLAAGEILLCWHEEHWEAPRLRWSENRGGVWRSGVAGRQPLPRDGCNNRGPLLGHDWDLLGRLVAD